MTVQFKEKRKTYKVKRFPASAAMNIKAGLFWQPPVGVAVFAWGGPLCVPSPCSGSPGLVLGIWLPGKVWVPV